jgi:hypothetical protein
LSQLGILIDIPKNKDGTDKGILYKLAESNEWLSGSSIDRSLSLRGIIDKINQNTSKSAANQSINVARARQINQYTQRPIVPTYTRERS